MAGLNPVGAGLRPDAGPVSSRQHFATITWLRWRIFVNSLRGKGAAGEIAVKILSYPILAVIVLGPSVGSAFAGYYLVSQNMVKYLAAPLWIIFGLWQMIGLNTSATGPSFNLSSLVRFPIRYRDYLLIRLSFGLLDPPTIAGVCCLFALSIGIGIANISLFPWAFLALLIYALCNILFSRMIYSWMERWLAQRRTRELITGLILLVSLGVQFASQFAQRIGSTGHHGHRAPLSPVVRQAIHAAMTVNWLLPPGLTAASIDHIHMGMPLIAVAALAGLLAYTSVFFLVFQLRMRAEYRGESLSEAPIAVKKKARRSVPVSTASSTTQTSTASAFAFLPATVAAGLLKEIRYLVRSGPKLYTLIMPVFVVFLVSMRTSGMNYTGIPSRQIQGMLFTYGCAYAQFIFVAFIYNSLGTDGAGVQFYFIAPVRIREVMLSKNLLTFSIFVIELILIYIVAAIVSSPPSSDLAVATLAWSLFVFFLNLTIGNIRSIVSPRALDISKVRGQNLSGMSGLISLAVVAICGGLGAGTIFLSRFLHISFWGAAAAFGVLAVLSFTGYVVVLGKIDAIAASNVEDLTRTLSRA